VKQIPHPRLAVLSLAIVSTFGSVPSHAQTSELAQNPPATAVNSIPQKIVSKDPLYGKLLNPPEGNDFLKIYSKSYRDASADIDAKIAGITDEALRHQAFNDEWNRVLKQDGDNFRYEADVNFREAKLAFAREHRDAWLDAGRVYYEEINNVLAVAANPASPIAANFRWPMKPSVLNDVYVKFHQIAVAEIEEKAREYVARSGAGSNCARNSDWCLNLARQDVEQRLRSERIVAVAQGDLESGRIDHMMLVDYETETVLLPLDSPASMLASAAWKFSIGPVPAAPQPPPTAPQVQAAAAEPATPLRVPANVTAASILERTPPQYPAQARARLIQGDVLLHAIIDKEGKISEAQVLSGDDLLAQPALEAVRRWRYKPMLVDGVAREVDTTITVTFSLKE
jgi:TonB family protein